MTPALLALPVVALLGVLAGLRWRAARAWAETCARTPWRIAAVRDGGPLMLLMDDDVLRLWWEREGRRLPQFADLARAEALAADVRDPDEPRLRAWFNSVRVLDLRKFSPHDPTKGP